MLKITKVHAIIFALFVVQLAFGSDLTAANPDWPNGPDEDPRLAQPDDGNFEGRWYLLSYIPDQSLSAIRPEEIPMGSGVHADRAWQVTQGNPDVVIAVLDSGVNWENYDLINQFYINKGEVPLPEDAQDYDVDGNGIFDIRDYASDSRVYDANGNGRIEPGDLIKIFSDGFDDDGNGYADDISGWDFFHHDNDPADVNRFGHGTGEALMAAAQTNNGTGTSGVCPRCRIMPVRVGDSFVADVNNFAMGVVFAVDTGAKVILEALGTVNNSAFAQDAVEYAVNSGVSIAASAADENSYHHNYPANYNRTVHTNNIQYDNSDRSLTTSFLMLDACTNWGPKITVSASSYSCSSGATGIMGGALGMIYSRAEDIDLDPPLSSSEVFGLVTAGAMDIYVPEAQTDPTIYPSRPGWDKYFGHGRLNVRNSVDMVSPETIPPEAYIEYPGWHELISGEEESISVKGYVDARRAGSFSYQLEIAQGLSPEEGDWSTVKQRANLTNPVDGEIGVVQIDALITAKATNLDPTEDYAWLLRLTVQDSLGNAVKYYHSFYIHWDQDWSLGFPIDLHEGVESGPVMTDLDGDGDFELIAATAGGAVHAFKDNGSEVNGWPVYVDLLYGLRANDDPNYQLSAAYASGAVNPQRRQAVLGALAAGDLDADGFNEVVAATLDGAVYAWRRDGQLLDGFPVALDPDYWADALNGAWLEYGIFGAPALVNLDLSADGSLEIVVAGMDQWVYAWHVDGEPVNGWPVLCRDKRGKKRRIVSSPGIGDIDGDGRYDVIVTTNEDYSETGRIYAVYADGNDHPGGPFLPGWPVTLPSLMIDYLPLIGHGAPISPALADFDADGADEIVTHAGVGFPMILDGDGSVLKYLSPLTLGLFNGTDELLMGVLIGNYSIGDLHGDGRLCITCAGVGARFAMQMYYPGERIPADALVNAWSYDTGTRLFNWPLQLEDMQFLGDQAVADIDGDDKPEVILGSAGHYAHAYDYRGREPAGWPKFTGNWIPSTVAVGDAGGDGYLEVAVTTRDGRLYMYNTTGPANGNVQWSSQRHDPKNTGNFHTALPRQAGPDSRPRQGESLIGDDNADDESHGEADRDVDDGDPASGMSCGFI